jgi:SAM-dependent methyltransferase
MMDLADDFYDEQYYLSHYDRERTNPKYYDRISAFWKYNIFDSNNVRLNGKVLDYGAGLGQVSAAMHADCYDFSGFARKFLRSKNRVVFDSPADIPVGTYDYLISSHCMEHVRSPFDELLFLRKLLKPGGTLVLIVPIEVMPGSPTSAYDDNKHFYNWNFQSMTNILLETGYQIKLQKTIYGPFMLSRLENLALARQFGVWKRNFPSILTMGSTTISSP